MIRLKDIAARAGVSVMTVSKVLRDAPDISDQTKAKVRLLAKEMGYVPDTVAQGLRTRCTRLFGLVISAMTNPIFARVVMAIEERSVELGYEVILSHSLNDPEREEMVIRRLISRRVDGLFIAPVYRVEPVAPIYDELRRLELPTVLLAQQAPFCQAFPNVEVEDEAASAALTRHLLGLGHRRIGFFAGSPKSPSAVQRLAGYQRSLRNAGVAADDRLVYSAGSTIKEGENAARLLLQDRTSVTAVQAVSDLVAIGAGSVLLSNGYPIPAAVSLTGFGNLLTSEYFRVPLTTVRQPKYRLGLAAMEMMLELLCGREPETRTLAAEILVRDSTGPVDGGSQ